MATRFQFIDDSGETRLAGFLVPDPAFDGGTITSELDVSPTSTTAQDILLLTAPVGYEAGSNTGGLIRAIAEDGTVAVLCDTFGRFNFTAPTGQGAALLQVLSQDAQTTHAQLESDGYLELRGNNAEISMVTAGNVRLFDISPLMGVLLTTHTAPTDNNLNAGELSLWFDQTNGAGKLKIKAKTADGTVVTGSVNLA